ncbi:NAD+ synthase [Candidatus Poribacteria bacterium]|nr:NAD+ synthase [Candidatus Poribacteria bacterium]
MQNINIRLALAQINTSVGDIHGNVQKIITYIKSAEKQNADIVIFPELAITGYPPEDLLLKKMFVEKAEEAFQKIKTEVSKDIIVIAGGICKIKQNLFNSAAVIHNHKIIDIYNKIFLPNYGVFDEKRYFTQGDKNKIYKFDKIKFGINICEDIWYENGPASKQVKEGNASLIIVINSSPYHSDKLAIRQEMLIKQAKKLHAHIVYVNLVGGQDELVFDGYSMAISPDGKILNAGKQFEEDLIVNDYELSIPKSNKKIKDIVEIKIPKTINSQSDKLSFSILNKKLSSIEEIYKALITGTHDYIRKNKFQKVVIGLSGGIDSALTAAIAVDALGASNVNGVFMPSQYSSKESEDDAKALAQNLNINYLNIPIKSIFEIYLQELRNIGFPVVMNIAEENLQARIRGNILMALSNKYNWLVLTTGNKSEMSVGYATLYGDMAGGFAVIKDVFKTLVYQLVNYRNSINKVIPENVITKAPTAELRPNQKDTDSLPPYEILDPILQAYIEEDKTLDKIISSCPKVNEEMVRKVISMVDKSEYKRSQSPPGVKITPLALGKDRRMPITNRFSI